MNVEVIVKIILIALFTVVYLLLFIKAPKRDIMLLVVGYIVISNDIHIRDEIARAILIGLFVVSLAIFDHGEKVSK